MVESMRAITTIAAALTISGVGGCIPKARTSFDSPAPSKRLDAIVAAADQRDPETLRRLVERLDAEDAVERMLAIRALERRTGETFGYRFEDPEWVRREAVDRWVAFVEAEGSAVADGGRP